jgi:hypothetical protein
MDGCIEIVIDDESVVEGSLLSLVLLRSLTEPN